MAMRLDAYEAVEEKIIDLEVKPVDTYKRAEVDIHNNTKKDVDLDFSRTGFIPVGDSDAQRLGLAYVAGQEPGAYIISIPAGGRGSTHFEARCLDYHRPAPTNGLLYVPMPVPLPPLLIEMMRRGVSQQDVWCDIENTPQLIQEWQDLDPRDPELNPGSIPISAEIPLAPNLAGEWFSPEHRYAFRFVGTRGLITATNHPNQKIGEECIRVTWIEGNRIKGEHGFTDDTWHPIEGEFISETQLRIRSRGIEWVLVKKTGSSPDELDESDIIGSWEGAHPVQDGSVMRIERAASGEFKYVGTYTKVGSNLLECKFSVGEVGIWLNQTSIPGEFTGRLKRRYPGSGAEEINNVVTILSNKNYIVSTDKHGSFESRRV